MGKKKSAKIIEISRILNKTCGGEGSLIQPLDRLLRLVRDIEEERKKTELIS